MMRDLRKIIEYAIKLKEDSLFDKAFIELLDQESLKIEYVAKNERLIFKEMPSNYIFILLKGLCCSDKYSPSGKLLTTVASRPVQIYGLFEAVHPTLNQHTTTIRCISDCAYIRIPIQIYVNQLLTDPKFSWLNMQYLSSFIDRVLTENENLLLNNTRDKLLLQIFQYCENKEFPVVVKTKKEELAQLLNTSLRTLYRQLDCLYSEGLISSEHGKIIIYEPQYREMQKIINTFF